MSTRDGYCDNGIHHVGDRDHCAKCAVWQRDLMEDHLFHGVIDARRLLRSIQSRE